MTEAQVAKMVGEAMRNADPLPVQYVYGLLIAGTYMALHLGKAAFSALVQIMNAKNGRLVSGDDSSVTRRECDHCNSNLHHRLDDAKKDREGLSREIKEVKADVSGLKTDVAAIKTGMEALPDRIVSIMRPNAGGG